MKMNCGNEEKIAPMVYDGNDDTIKTNGSNGSKTQEQVSSSSDSEITNAELGLAENHFSVPEGHFGLTTIEELEMAIEHCKLIILEAPEKSERRKSLVRKLVNLRLKLQEVKEVPEVLPDDVHVLLGHHFEKKEIDRPKVKRFCDKCSGNIWGVLHAWYECQRCGYSCHMKCLSFVTRMCASVKVKENPSYITSICPEVGLAAQSYRCAECRSPILNKAQYVEPRLCDYNGQYYCALCHWNCTAILPARVLHNWDFEPQKVCRSSKEFLQLMKRKAILNVQRINPMLFSFVEELGLVKKLRENILSMKQYFLSCKNALENKLLLQLSSRQHFVDGADMYSMQDLEDTASGILIEFLMTVHLNFSNHIKKDCQVCQGKGHICEVCSSSDVLYPFDDSVVTCSGCSAVFHTECYYRRDQTCPKCQRHSEKTGEINGIMC